MSAVWKLKDLADSEMLVLLAMADWSDKDGVCWPSIAQLADKTNKGERTIQGAIKAIVAKGHLTRNEVPGRGCRYVVHPRSGRTPAAAAPPQGTTDTPAAAAPNTSIHTIPQKASPSSGKRAKPAKPSMTLIPSDFEPVMRDGSITATTVNGWPPGRLADELEHFIDHHTVKATHSADWQASWRTWVKNSKKWEPRHGNQPNRRLDAQPDLRGRRPDPALDLIRTSDAAERAAQEACGSACDWPDYRGTWTALPSGGCR